MKTIPKYVAVLLVGLGSFLVVSCLTSPRSLSLQVSAGDSKAQVVSVLGTPLDRQLKASSEAWQYASIASIGICEYTVIWFTAGKVTGITTYRNSSVMGCAVGVRTVNWEEAPDAVVEIRNG